jgi:hypothetical protein
MIGANDHGHRRVEPTIGSSLLVVAIACLLMWSAQPARAERAFLTGWYDRQRGVLRVAKLHVGGRIVRRTNEPASMKPKKIKGLRENRRAWSPAASIPFVCDQVLGQPVKVAEF